MIGLDTNIFIYWLEPQPEFHTFATSIFKSIEDGTTKATASELVYLEVLSGSHLSADDARLLAASFSQIVPLAPVSQTTLLEAARLRRDYRLGALDAVHVASALLAGCEQFVTNDRELLKREVPGIEIVALSRFHLSGA